MPILPVCLIYEPIIENPIDLMYPEPYEFVPFCHTGGRHQQHTSDYASKVSQVEHIVALTGGGQEIGDGLLVHTHGGLDHHLRGEMRNQWAREQGKRST